MSFQLRGRGVGLCISDCFLSWFVSLDVGDTESHLSVFFVGALVRQRKGSLLWMISSNIWWARTVLSLHYHHPASLFIYTANLTRCGGCNSIISYKARTFGLSLQFSELKLVKATCIVDNMQNWIVCFSSWFSQIVLCYFDFIIAEVRKHAVSVVTL